MSLINISQVLINNNTNNPNISNGDGGGGDGGGFDVEFFDITEGERIFTVIFLSIVTVATIAGNSLALHAFIISPELKKITYYFIASLCISDLMVAIFSIPFWIAETIMHWRQSVPKELGYFISCLDIFCATWSITSLAMISIERYICITYALHYYRIMTTKRVTYILMFIMFYTSMTTTINYLSNFYDGGIVLYMLTQWLILLLAYVLPVVVKLFSYSRIFNEAQKQAKLINKYKFSLGKKDDEEPSTTSDSIDGSNGIILIESNDNDSLSSSVKTSHSNSRVSWTVSPISRRRQHCTKECMKVKSDLNNDDDVKDHHVCDEDCDRIYDDEDNDNEYYYTNKEKMKERESDGLLKQRFQSFLQRTTTVCFKGNKGEILDHNDNANEKIALGRVESCHEETGSLLENKSYVLQRHDTNGSIKSILKKTSQVENEYKMNIINEDEQKRHSAIHFQLNEKEKKDDTTKKSKSLREKCLVYDDYESEDEDEKKLKNRSMSCPPKTRKSLDAVDAARQNGTSSPFLKRIRGSSKWSPSNSPSVFRKNTSKQKRQEQKFRRFKKELRAAKVVGLIMGTFLLCWTPFIVVIILNLFSVPISMTIVVIVKDLHYMNSAINPILYVILNKVYRSAVYKAINKIKRNFRCD